MPLLEIRGLSKLFGGLQAVNNFDLRVERGEIVSLIGPNGAGKTTVFNLITGLDQPDSGDIRFKEESILGLPPHEITKRGIARTFQMLRVFSDMTVLENVMVAGQCQSKARLPSVLLRLPHARQEERQMQEKAKELLAFFGERLVGYRFDQPAMALSYANRRRLEIVRAMATGAELLLLDEPCAGMNPHETLEMTHMIARLRAERGYTILLIEHDMRVVGGISDRVIVQDHGRKIAEGSYDEIISNREVIEAYLGKKAEKASAKTTTTRTYRD
jgi:ABC-type branched-subunit amino acid transport system ATPase component